MFCFIQGDCVCVMVMFLGNVVDFIFIDLLYFVGFCDCQGCIIVGDKIDEWL